MPGGVAEGKPHGPDDTDPVGEEKETAENAALGKRDEELRVDRDALEVVVLKLHAAARRVRLVAADEEEVVHEVGLAEP